MACPFPVPSSVAPPRNPVKSRPDAPAGKLLLEAFMILQVLGASVLSVASVSGPNEPPSMVGEVLKGSLPVLGSGEDLSFSRFQGQALAIVVWSGESPKTCALLSAMAKVEEEFAPRGVAVLGINVDDDADSAQRLRDGMRIDFPVLLDPGAQQMRRLGIEALPQTLLVNPEGKVLKQFVGWESQTGVEIRAAIKDEAAKLPPSRRVASISPRSERPLEAADLPVGAAPAPASPVYGKAVGPGHHRAQKNARGSRHGASSSSHRQEPQSRRASGRAQANHPWS